MRIRSSILAALVLLCPACDGQIDGSGSEQLSPDAITDPGPTVGSGGAQPVGGGSLPSPNANNTAPTISSFSATLTRGAVPLRTTLSWSVSDAEGQALRCDLAVGNLTPQTYQPCPLSEAHPLTLSTEGTQPIRLTVTDSMGAKAVKELWVTGLKVVGDVAFGEVTWGQSILAKSPRLVEGKPVLLRVFVLGSTAGITGAKLRLTVSIDGQALGTMDVAGPSALPISANVAALNQSFNAELPAGWVKPGLRVSLQLDPEDLLVESNENNNTLTLSPTVGAGTVLRMALSPIISGGQAAVLPSRAEVMEAMTRMWPIRQVDLTVRAAYTFSNGSLATAEGWNNLLQELDAIRVADDNGRNYYGMVPVGSTGGSGLAGLGYIGSPTAIGYDKTTVVGELPEWFNTIIHEEGHNFGRDHAPCGGPAGPDPKYPYAKASIGTYGYDAIRKILMSPGTAVDLMSYCSPYWVSDYNYSAVQAFLETNTRSSTSELALARSAPQAMISVGGSVGPAGATLRPLRRHRGTPGRGIQDGSPYRVVLEALSGRIELGVEMKKVADLYEQSHFNLTLPDPGPIYAVELRHQDELLKRLELQPAPTSALMARSAELAPTLSERPNVARLTWDAARYPTLAVSHVGAEGRTTLALELTGGVAEVSTLGLEQGGTLELSLSNGVESTVVYLPRNF